jgi:hypothetical protein
MAGCVKFSKPHNITIARRKFPDATAYERGLNTLDGLMGYHPPFLIIVSMR